ncbi:MAG: hypothetical protein AAFN92_00565 [Bacteroidota bacterium]
MQLLRLIPVLTTVLSATPNTYLILLAALGWLLSLYFGFFRYRQFIWSRHKVRTDLLLKLDRQRASLAAKVLVVANLGKGGNRNRARLDGLQRRYADLLRQMDFAFSDKLVDDKIFAHWNRGVSNDLTDWHAQDPVLTERLANRTRLPDFARNLLDQTNELNA